MRQPGNTILEYGLAGAVIMVASLMVLMAVSNRMNTWLNSLGDDMQGNIVAARAPQNANGNAAGTNNDPNQPDTFGDLIQGGPEIQNALVRSLQTTGANGTTKELADRLKVYARKKFQNGDITEEQLNSLLELANRGHQIAEVEAAIEAHAQRYPNAADFKATKILFNGKLYDPRSLALTVGWQGRPEKFEQQVMQEDIFSLHTGTYAKLSPYMARFVDTYKAAEQSGVLQDSEIHKVVSTLSSEIVVIGEMTEHFVSGTGYNPDSSYQPKDINQIMASKVSHMNSAVICAAGANQDNGKHCQSSQTGS